MSSLLVKEEPVGVGGDGRFHLLDVKTSGQEGSDDEGGGTGLFSDICPSMTQFIHPVGVSGAALHHRLLLSRRYS